MNRTVTHTQTRLLLLRCFLVSFLGRLRCEINNLAIIVPSAVHADSVALVHSTAILTLRSTCCVESVVGAAIITM